MDAARTRSIGAMRRITSAVLVVTAFLAAGCGDSSGDDAKTSSAPASKDSRTFVQRAEATCAQARQLAESLDRATPQNATARAKPLTAGAAIARARHRSLAALVPPSSAADRWRAFLAADLVSVKSLERLAPSVDAGGPGRVKGLTTYRAAVERTRAAATAAGVKACAGPIIA